MSLHTAHRTSLVDQVIDQLTEAIAGGSWQVGTKIPTETVLAGQLGVGRNTVREAVRALTHAGLLECRQGDGTYIRSRSELSGVLVRSLRHAKHMEIFEVRRALEIEAARLAALHRTHADIALLDVTLAERERAWHSDDVSMFVELDLAFHDAVVQATHNRMMIEIYTGFSSELRSSIKTAGRHMRAPLISHDGIARAIAAADAAAAEHAARTCMEDIRAALIRADGSRRGKRP
ncbi:FadR/GntR family transcriptional regulator [Nonomuraea basaltis]|uniref:FadR/GntR family transcriptional regulator n=1 Tax=Nonomuraea basaltis TaxID=2495887 RepID=UPI00110C531E|nr:FCD domain-containing protein [Nonomuraea basaltis]TMR90135.1 FadR family transcriptional regulator [Nonomuraea basaltis]